jgi:hypothetical protein
MIDKGIFTLKTPAELFQKLLRDHQHLKNEPLDSYGWFNFVVTADHLPEWELKADEEAANKLRKSEPLLRICNHLSRNAKHFEARQRIPINAVAQTTEVTIARFLADPAPGLPSVNASPRSTRPPVPQEFMLTLSPREAKELGTTELSALEFAARVVEFWRRRLNLPA